MANIDTSEVKKAIEDVVGRFKSPFFGAYIVSWIFCNWVILVGLFFDSIYTLNSRGYTSYFHFVSSFLNINNSIYYPVSLAILYVLMQPLIRGGIDYYYTFIKLFIDDKILSKSKQFSMPFSLYQLKINELASEKSQFKQLMTEYESKDNELVDLRSQINDLKESTLKLDQEIELNRIQSTPHVVKGYYEVKYAQQMEDSNLPESLKGIMKKMVVAYVSIEDEIIYELKIGRNISQLFEIFSVKVEVFTGRISLVLLPKYAYRRENEATLENSFKFKDSIPVMLFGKFNSNTLILNDQSGNRYEFEKVTESYLMEKGIK
jgi:hypothetical protein